MSTIAELRKSLEEALLKTFTDRASEKDPNQQPLDAMKKVAESLATNIYTYSEELLRNPSGLTFSVSFDDVTNTPNSLKGYGISDAYDKKYIDAIIQKKTSGVVVAPTINFSGNNITLSNSKVALYSTPNFSGYLKEYDVFSTTYSVDSLIVHYIVIDYNEGTPIYRLTANRSEINYSDVIPVVTVIYDGDTIHSVNWDASGLGTSERILKRLNRTQRFQREGGLLISVASDRSISVSTSVIHFGVTEITYPTTSSLIRNIYSYYHSGSSWIYSRTPHLNNLEYDNGSNKVELSNTQRYAVNWVYAGVGDDGDIITVLGNGDYKLDEAINAQPPIDLPDIIKFHGILVGKVIYSKGSDTTTVAISLSEQAVSSYGVVTEHNNLNGIQGGIADEYYHLNEEEHSKVSSLNGITTLVEETSGGKTVTLESNLVVTGDVAFYSTSDKRLKESVVPLRDSLEFIKKVNPCSFSWNDLANKRNSHKNGSDVGVIAQDMIKLDPSFVGGIQGDYLGVNYEKFIPYLIGAIKELNDEVEHLKKIINNGSGSY